MYLNKFGFNGPCRYNRKGVFNVTYGYPARLPSYPFEKLEVFREKATRALFVNEDFVKVMQMATPGDVVYCDPPYLDSSVGSKTFTAYSASGFSFERQQELAALARKLAKRGIPVVVSNHDSEAARPLYERGRIIEFEA